MHGNPRCLSLRYGEHCRLTDCFHLLPRTTCHYCKYIDVFTSLNPIHIRIIEQKPDDYQKYIELLKPPNTLKKDLKALGEVSKACMGWLEIPKYGLIRSNIPPIKEELNRMSEKFRNFLYIQLRITSKDKEIKDEIEDEIKLQRERRTCKNKWGITRIYDRIQLVFGRAAINIQ